MDIHQGCINFSHILNFLIAGVPTKIIVTLLGAVKKDNSSKGGIYILQTNYVSNNKHWLQQEGSNALWYNKNNQKWNIGGIENLGSDISGIISDKSIGPLEATSWKYWSCIEHIWIEATDLIILSAGI